MRVWILFVLAAGCDGGGLRVVIDGDRQRAGDESAWWFLQEGGGLGLGIGARVDPQASAVDDEWMLVVGVERQPGGFTVEPDQSFEIGEIEATAYAEAQAGSTGLGTATSGVLRIRDATDDEISGDLDLTFETPEGGEVIVRGRFDTGETCFGCVEGPTVR